jgi:hypothetical protein
LNPPLSAVPLQAWFCKECETAGVIKELGRTARAELLYKREDKQQRRLDKKAAKVAAAERKAAKTAARAAAEQPRVEPTRKSRRQAGIALVGRLSFPGLPLRWDWSSPPQAKLALSLLMPGVWGDDHARWFSALCPGGPGFVSQSEYVSVEEVEVLLQAVDFSLSGSIVDMCVGAQGVARCFRAHGFNVVTNDFSSRIVADFHGNVLQPEAYAGIKQHHGMQCVIMSPGGAIPDAVLPLAVSFVSHLACCRVPATFLSSPHPSRVSWINGMQSGERLHVIKGPSAGPGKVQYLWFLVFASAACKQLMMYPGRASALGDFFKS